MKTKSDKSLDEKVKLRLKVKRANKDIEGKKYMHLTDLEDRIGKGIIKNVEKGLTKKESKERKEYLDVIRKSRKK